MAVLFCGRTDDTLDGDFVLGGSDDLRYGDFVYGYFLCALKSLVTGSFVFGYLL